MVRESMCIEPNSGQIGVRCDQCSIRLTFGQAMVVDDRYYCWEHYQLITGATPSTDGVEPDPIVYHP